MKTVLKYLPEVLNICEKSCFTYRILVYNEANYLVEIYDRSNSPIVSISGYTNDGSDICRMNATILLKFIECYNNSWLSDSDYMRENYEIIRLPHDICGNPRYYLSRNAFTDNEGTNPDILAKRLGAVKYRGSKYGKGYVFTTYNLDEELANLCRLAGHRE